MLYHFCEKSSKLTSLDVMDEQTKAEKIMMTKEKADYSELYQAINALKEELRLPVILYYIEDFNIRENRTDSGYYRRCSTETTCQGKRKNLDAICEKVRRRYEV